MNDDYEKYTIDVIKQSYKDSHSGREDNSIHASHLTEFCSRSYALCHKDKRKFHPKSYIGLNQSVTFDVGNLVHDAVKKRFARTKLLIGEWECLHCKNIQVGFQPKICHCSGTHFRYRELKVPYKVSEDMDCVGSIDAVLAYDVKKCFAIEIKSIRPEGWKDSNNITYQSITEPMLEHRMRMNVYLWLLKNTYNKAIKNLGIDTTRGLVLYVNKGQSGMKEFPMKPFVVNYDPKIIRPIEDKIKELKTFSKNGKLPKRICKQSLNLMARSCVARDLCFKGE